MAVITRPAASGGGASTPEVTYQRYIKPSWPDVGFHEQTRAGIAAAVGLAFEVDTACTLKSIQSTSGSVSTGNFRAAVYGPAVTPDVLTGAPLVVQSADLVCPAAYNQLDGVVADTVLQPGQYFAMFQFSAATQKFAGIADTEWAPYTMRPYFNQAYGAFPATAPTASNDSLQIPLIHIKVADA